MLPETIVASKRAFIFRYLHTARKCQWEDLVTSNLAPIVDVLPGVSRTSSDSGIGVRRYFDALVLCGGL